MKKFTKLFILSALILCSLGIFCACTPKDGIAINTEFKTEYYVGEELDVSGGIIDFTKNGETIHVAIVPSMISAFSTESAGTKNLVITYTDAEEKESYTLTVEYVVKEIPSFPLDQTGTVVYKSTEKVLSDNYEAIMLRGNKIQISAYTDDLTFDSSIANSQLTIHSREYNKQKNTWEILTMATGGGFYKITNITESSFVLETYSMLSSTPGTEVAPNLNNSQMIMSTIFIKDASTPKDGIAINTKFKTEYYVGEELDVTGGIIDFTKDGETIQVAIESSMISAFSTESAGTRNLIISYVNAKEEKTYTLTVEYVVKDIPIFPLDQTGTVVYKSTEKVSSGNYAAIMFRVNKMKFSTYTNDLTFDSSNTISLLTIYSREYNKQKNTWEIITMATGGGFYKITNITESSFVIELYAMSGSTPGTEVVPDVDNAQFLQSMNFNKVA